MDGSRKVNPKWPSCFSVLEFWFTYQLNSKWTVLRDQRGRISEHVKRGRPVFIFSAAQFHLFGLPTLDLTRNRTNLSNNTVLDITRNRGFGFLKFFRVFFIWECDKEAWRRFLWFQCPYIQIHFWIFFRRQYIFNIFEQSIWRIIRKHLNRLNRSPKRILN